MEDQQQVWFITGCSRGIGQAIAHEAMRNGHFVAATARKLADLEPLLKTNAAMCLPVEMDVDNEASIQAGVAAVLEKYGRIDVLINNAGYGLQGTIEEVAMKQVRAQMETNFFGLFSVTQAVLPTMRNQKSGYIVNVASIAGLRGSPTFGAYNASKFAVVGLSEALAQEVAPFGIRVSIVEPGPYRTDWAGSSLKRSEAMGESEEGSPYQELNSNFKEMLDARAGKQPGNPRQIAQVLLLAAKEENPPLHMIFGDPAIEWWNQRMEDYQKTSFMQLFPHHKLDLE